MLGNGNILKAKIAVGMRGYRGRRNPPPSSRSFPKGETPFSARKKLSAGPGVM
jgi:hypothetical protein